MNRIHLPLLVLGLLSFFARDAEALCMATSVSAVILTPLDAPVPADGALLASVLYGGERGGVQVTYGQPGEFTLPALALVTRTRRIGVSQRPLPGGLLLLTFDTPPPAGRYTLEGFSGPSAPAPSVTIGGTLPPAPSAPQLASVDHSVRYETYQGPRGSGRLTIWETEVTFREALPAGLAFVVLRTVGSTQDLQFFEARSGTDLHEGGTLGGRCAMGFVEGRGMVTERAQVEAVVIDHFGRMSAPSAPVRVR